MFGSTAVQLAFAALTQAGAVAMPAHAAMMSVETDSLHPAPAAPLSAMRPSDGTRMFTMREKTLSNGSVRDFGTMTVTQQTIDTGAQRLLRRVIVFDYGANGRVVDTAVSIASTLAPVYERTYKPSGLLFEDFAGRFVTGRMGPATAPTPIRDSLPTPAFNSTDAEFVIRSLDLRVGLDARLPLYDPEQKDRYRFAAVHVEGTEMVSTPTGRREAWVVRLTDTHAELVFRVDKESRAFLASSTRVPDRDVEYDITLASGPGPV